MRIIASLAVCKLHRDQSKFHLLAIALLLLTTTNLVSINFAVAAAGSIFGSNARLSFWEGFFVEWASDHVSFLDGGATVQLKLDSSSGSGFASNKSYMYGFLSMDLKLVPGDSAGTVTSFYLASSHSGPHEELDFEFLGNTLGKPIVLQTNVFANGTGGREQRLQLWFDPVADFHTYSIIWNSEQILFYVDSTLIRVYPKKVGILYPNIGPMAVYCTLYDGSDWATNGGKTEVDWSNAPFVASYKNFYIDACEWSSSSGGGGGGSTIKTSSNLNPLKENPIPF
ncbi:unnamed protein product, partial [Sphagnum jensenii]